MESKNPQDGMDASSRTVMTAPAMNATATFKAGMLDLEKRMNAAGDSSCMTCFGGKQSVPAMGRPSQVQMEGKKILRALSAFSCISLKTLSSPGSSDRKSSLEAEGVAQNAAAGEEGATIADLTECYGGAVEKGDPDPRILLRIVMWGGPNTLLLLAPFDAPAECVIEMVLDSYVKGVGLQECRDFELFCAHCNSPALHPKQPIGSVGSRHFLLCKKGPQISGVSFFNSHSQISQSSHSLGSKHSQSGHSHSNSNSSNSFKHSRSFSHGNSSLSHSSSGSQSHHRRSNSWWNPVQCLTVDQH